jgi:hypothetical protein
MATGATGATGGLAGNIPGKTQGKDQENYLRDCFEQFSSLCQVKYRKEFDLASVETKVRHLRCQTPLKCTDLDFFESPEHWWFQRFWVFPPRESIAPALEAETFDFWNLPESNETGTIRRLLHIFKSIELVSIILRFIRPEHYGIYSAPVQHMLDIRHGRDLVETYVSYLENLREIQRRYGFCRVADVDMALWVLHEKCFGRHQDAAIADRYQNDDFLLRLRTTNLVAPLAELSEARLACALATVKPDIAALIACHCLEMQIRALAGRFRLPETDLKADLENVIETLPNYGPVTAMRKALWQSLRQVRNDFIHHGRMPGLCEHRLLLQEITQLEVDLRLFVASGDN